MEGGVGRGQGCAVELSKGRWERMTLVGCPADRVEGAERTEWPSGKAQKYGARGEVRGIRVSESGFMQRPWPAVEDGAG